VNTTPWKPGSATGIGSLPGTDPREASRIVLGELPVLPHLPELPERGVGADLIGRTAGLLVDIPVEVVPSGYRVTAHPGRDHRRATDLMSYDLDAFEEAVQTVNLRPEVVKIQIAGPWTLMSNVELVRGHRILTDPGAVKEFTESLAEGLKQHIAEVRKRTGAQVVVQLDEPGVPAVLGGLLPTPSKLGTVRAVPEPDARDVLAAIIDVAGPGAIVHCCAPKPPVTLFREAGATAVALDVSLLRGAGKAVADELGEAWQAGTSLWLGLVPSADPGTKVELRELARPALELADRLGFPRSVLTDLALPTPTCGMAGASEKWVRRALSFTRDLGKAFLEPPEDW
jgi:methionine synthase II (cobalamin-independent)